MSSFSPRVHGGRPYPLEPIWLAILCISARFERSAIRPYFRDVFISEAIGCGKPSPAYFAYVLRAVPGLTAENGLVIGDSLTSDIQGANNAGLACCWFNPHPALRRLPFVLETPTDDAGHGEEIAMLRERLGEAQSA